MTTKLPKERAARALIASPLAASAVFDHQPGHIHMTALYLLLSALDELDADDCLGTEGWRHFLRFD